jgi:ATP-dependent Clp protease adaptor protein ClpS
MADPSRPGGGDTLAEPRTRTERQTRLPDLYKVLLHNDDYTTQEFVDFVLMHVFNHDPDTAHRIMLNVHMRGVGIAGIYPWEIAETKAAKATTLAREREFPLLITIEPE